VDFVFDYHGNTLPPTDTGGSNTIATIAATQFVRQSKNQSTTGGSQWMTDTDRTSVDIDFLNIQSQVLDTGYGLTGEGLIDFPTVDVLDLKAGLLER
jgi:hypothetical protein